MAGHGVQYGGADDQEYGLCLSAVNRCVYAACMDGGVCPGRCGDGVHVVLHPVYQPVPLGEC